MDNQNVVYTYRAILFSLKKEGDFAICYNMVYAKNIMLSEISQSQKDKHSFEQVVFAIPRKWPGFVYGVWGEVGVLRLSLPSEASE